MDRLIRVPLTRPPPVWVIAMAKLGMLHHRLGGHEGLLQILCVHLD